MRLSYPLLLVAYGASVLAMPSSCNRGDQCIAVLTGPLKTIAIAFCRAWLGETTVTTTKSVTVTGKGTTATVTQPTVTNTATAYTTTSTTSTETDTVYQANPTVTVDVTTTFAYVTIILKRDKATAHATPSIPTALASFEASRISSACSCIVTPTTCTRVVTATTTASGPSATVTQAGPTVTTTSTGTVTTTIVNQVTTTAPPQGTDTVTDIISVIGTVTL